MLSPIAYLVVLAAVVLFAFLRGRRDEKFAASVCVFATAATHVAWEPVIGSYSNLELGVFIVDFGTLAAFTYLALRSDRFWPLWVAGLQLTTILSHVFKLVRLDLLPQAYAAAGRFWVYPIFLIIVIGTWRSYKRSSAEARESSGTVAA